MAVKQAKIECPHCGGSITVRQISGDDIPPEKAAKIWKAADEAFEAMETAFRKIFSPGIWR